MEDNGPKWLRTLNDGVLLFKNVADSVQESEKAEKKEIEYEHTQENSLIDFEKVEDKYQVDQRYLHTEMGVFCSISERIMGEDDKLKEIKVKLVGLDSEAIIPATEKDLEVLSDSLTVVIRITLKTGSKITLNGNYSLYENMQGNLKKIFNTIGLNSANFKVFHNDKLVIKNIDIDKIYEVGKDIYLMAFESQGKAKKWMRFPKVNDYTWSNSGYSSDAICFIPNKAISVAGFVSFVAKNQNDFELRYKIMINDVTKLEGPAKKYTDFEDTYYKTITFDEPIECPPNGKIDIWIWMASSLSSSSNVDTYYGSDGYDFATVQNEDMGLFTVESGSSSGNGTSTSSGQIPAILYYSD